MNVATHLLADVFRGEVEAAILVSNDSDLALPLTIARTLVPVGTVNPGTNPLAGALRGLPGEGGRTLLAVGRSLSTGNRGRRGHILGTNRRNPSEHIVSFRRSAPFRRRDPWPRLTALANHPDVERGRGR